VSWYQKGKTNLDFTEARDSEWHWDICKSAPRSRQITMSAVFGKIIFEMISNQNQNHESLIDLKS